MKKDYVTVEKCRDGGWLVTGLLSDPYGEYFHSHRYDGYTKAEAVAMFREQYRKVLVKS